MVNMKIIFLNLEFLFYELALQSLILKINIYLLKPTLMLQLF